MLHVHVDMWTHTCIRTVKDTHLSMHVAFLHDRYQVNIPFSGAGIKRQSLNPDSSSECIMPDTQRCVWNLEEQCAF